MTPTQHFAALHAGLSWHAPAALPFSVSLQTPYEMGMLRQLSVHVFGFGLVIVEEGLNYQH
jgi:hypothetical protein